MAASFCFRKYMTVIYVDESGDLGWTFTAPYRKGGSSRYLTIAAVLVSSDKKHLPKRLIKSLYQRLSVPAAEEIKWAALHEDDRLWLVQKIADLKVKLGDDLKLMSMTVRKQNVLPHIRNDANKLYNYMMNLLLTEEMANHPVVFLIPDQRSVKVASGNSMHDYLQTQLWFDRNAATQLKTSALDSSTCTGLQFADMVAGIVQAHFEDQKSAYSSLLAGHVYMRRLFF